MTAKQITEQISQLSHAERRELIRQLLAAEQDAALLAQCDRQALERFQQLDALEAADGSAPAR